MRASVLICFAAVSAAGPLPAQRIAVDGLATAELWKTDAGSRILARDSGRLVPELRLNAWAALQLAPALQLLALGTLEAGRAEAYDFDARLEQASLRFAPAPALVFEGGRILMPMGGFARRRFAHQNPLVGAPDMYPPVYPWGAQLSGVVGRVDWTAAVVSLPAVDTAYSPVPGHRARPVIGAGVSVGPGFRIGASITQGPYLSSSAQPQLPPGDRWQDYLQTVAAGELRFSAGYLDVRAEATWSRYEVPQGTPSLNGLGYFVELRGTVTPRLFLAGRFEWFRYPFILPINPNFWVKSETLQLNGEVGAGYRVTPGALVKLSYRRDYWPGDPPPNVPLPDGYAAALQVSLFGDMLAPFARRY